jgi:hypothetical protein
MHLLQHSRAACDWTTTYRLTDIYSSQGARRGRVLAAIKLGRLPATGSRSGRGSPAGCVGRDMDQTKTLGRRTTCPAAVRSRYLARWVGPRGVPFLVSDVPCRIIRDPVLAPRSAER